MIKDQEQFLNKIPSFVSNNQLSSEFLQPRPPSIVLRSSAKHLVSTTSTATYPLESNQFEQTESKNSQKHQVWRPSQSRQTVVINQYRNLPSPHRESGGQHGISLVSSIPGVSPKPVPLGSRILIRPSSSSSNLLECQASQFNPNDLVRKVGVTTRIGGDYVDNLLSSMRVQLQQMNINFSNKLSQEVQKHHEYGLINAYRQIRKLQRSLAHNQSLIRGKDQEIQSLRQVLRTNNQNKDAQISKLSSQIDTNYEYAAGKVRDLEHKVLAVVRMLDRHEKSGVLQTVGTTRLLRRVQSQTGDLKAVMGGDIVTLRGKVGQITQRVHKSVIAMQARTSQIECYMATELNKLAVTVGTSHGETCQDMDRLREIQNQLGQVGSRQGSMDFRLLEEESKVKEHQDRLESKLEQLQQDIAAKTQNLPDIDSQFKLMCDKLTKTQKQLQKQRLQLNDKEKKLEQKTRELKKQSQHQAQSSTSKTTQTNAEKSPEKVPRPMTRVPSVQYIQSLNASSSSYRSKVQITCNYSDMPGFMRKDSSHLSLRDLAASSENKPGQPIKLPSKLIDLQKMLRRSGIPLPVRCEIDQTGSLKDHQQGTYIFNERGDVFSLSVSQQKMAVKHRIISL